MISLILNFCLVKFMSTRKDFLQLTDGMDAISPDRRTPIVSREVDHAELSPVVSPLEPGSKKFSRPHFSPHINLPSVDPRPQLASLKNYIPTERVKGMSKKSTAKVTSLGVAI